MEVLFFVLVHQLYHFLVLQSYILHLQLISWLFADNLQISCGFLGGFEEKVCFCGRSVKYRRN